MCRFQKILDESSHVTIGGIISRVIMSREGHNESTHAPTTEHYPRHYAWWLRPPFDGPPVPNGSKEFPAVWTSCSARSWRCVAPDVLPLPLDGYMSECTSTLTVDTSTVFLAKCCRQLSKQPPVGDKIEPVYPRRSLRYSTCTQVHRAETSDAASLLRDGTSCSSCAATAAD